jgi:hypothetical protein
MQGEPQQSFVALPLTMNPVAQASRLRVCRASAPGVAADGETPPALAAEDGCAAWFMERAGTHFAVALRSCQRFLGLAAACLLTALAAHAQPITLNSLLQEMADRDALARFPAPAYTQGQGSTYNRASTARDQANQGAGGWFADSDGPGYIRTENTNAGGATEYVIVDHTGPGAITKLWTPFFYYGFDNRTGPRIKVYLNGANTPVLNENLIELVTRLEWSTAEYGAKPSPQNSFTVPSPIAGFTARAGNCYLPIPFASRCKVTISAAPFYDIVSYRAYAPGTTVENFCSRPSRSAARPTSLAASFSRPTAASRPPRPCRSRSTPARLPCAIWKSSSMPRRSPPTPPRCARRCSC